MLLLIQGKTVISDPFTKALKYQRAGLPVRLKQCTRYEGVKEKSCITKARKIAKRVCDKAYQRSQANMNFNGYYNISRGDPYNISLAE